jgi:hypothetical protein
VRSAKIILGVLSILGACALTQRVSSQSLAQSKRIVIAASAVLDGKGHELHDTRFVIGGSKIVAIDPNAGPVDYDLRGLTVLPGWIDVHVHIGWFFGKDGKLAGAGATPEEAAYAAASNAWVTLMAGFTTVQDMGSPVTMRDTIAKGMLPGPRILTGVGRSGNRFVAQGHSVRLEEVEQLNKVLAPSAEGVTEAGQPQDLGFEM